MRKLLLITVLALLPVLVFSLGFQIGPTALYNGIIDSSTTGPETISINDFTFGAEARLQMLGILEGSALALYTPEYNDTVYPMPAYTLMLLDAGLNLDLALISVGVGLGPNLLFLMSEESISDGIKVGFNIKTHADINLGNISLSLNFIMNLESLTQEALDALAENTSGYLGISMLFKLF